MLLNQLMEVVILLYLVEEEASWLVRVTSASALVLGFFKIFKSMRVKGRDAARAQDGASQVHPLPPLIVVYPLPS